MISTQRIMLIILGLSILIGIAGSIYNNVYEYTDNQDHANKITIIEGAETEFQTEENTWGGVKTSTVTDQKTIGSGVGWGKIILDIFTIGLNPFSIKPNNYNTYIEQKIAFNLLFLRMMMIALFMFEFVTWVKNRKTS